MEFEWNETKNALNIAKHGVSFDLIENLDWDLALVVKDEKHSDREPRFTAFGFIGDRLYVCVYTWRGHKRRIISLRKASIRERKRYEKKT